MEEKAQNFSEKFVHSILSRLDDRRLRACMRRADNKDTEYQAWEYLIPFGLPMDVSPKHQAYILVAAALAKYEPGEDGKYNLGKALSGIYGEGNAEQAKTRLRRLLACASTQEVCTVLRPMLGLIAKSCYPLSYARLMEDLLYFNEHIRKRWALDFFRSTPTTEQAGEEPA